MSEDQRFNHPFHMYNAIFAQPESFAEAIRRNKNQIDQVAIKIASCQRLFIVGIGTSYHAAKVGEYLMRTYCEDLFTYACHSFDFFLYGPKLNSTDCIIAISHRGNKIYTLKCLNQARELGCSTLFITGETAQSGLLENLDKNFTFQTVPQESSSAHTVSYIGTIAILAYLSGQIGFNQTNKILLSEEFLLNDIPQKLKIILDREIQMKQLANEYFKARRFWLVGGGENAITAHEIALKIKETSYLQAEAMSIEAILHGPLQCVETEDFFILIAPTGKAQKRVIELSKLVQEIGAHYIMIIDQPTQISLQNSEVDCIVPKVPEPFTALTCLLPLQLFAYYLALAVGTNPDGFRLEDPRFAKARSLIKL
ncbi:SIS domain-containing protein [Nostoc sp. PA-18-2419]|uniref:SIS domain-containing protein n=1 Tax=Nostoc sp. PA-18-2419 TaxID=2575443 RepID=UPI0011084B8F|nr:SIS domain-containing protein [Nostoc sp. PA-18-2419]